MRRARKVCSNPECSNLQPCAMHGRRAWQGSARDQGVRVLAGSQGVKRRRFVLDYYGTECHVCHFPGADEVDHVVPLSQGGSDQLENLRPIHGARYGPDSCHARKTAAEARAGMERSA